MTWKDVTITNEHGVLRASGTVDLIDIYSALWLHFGERRGVDTWTSPGRSADGAPVARPRRTPRTTCADVVQLSIFWTQQIATHPRTHAEVDGKRERWFRATSEIRTLAKSAQPTDVYPKNRDFWRAAQGAAIACDLEREWAPSPSPVDAVIGFFTDTIPDAIDDSLSWVGHTLESGATAAGRLAGGAARGVADGLGLKEILIGAGVITGAAIVLPALSKRTAAPKGGGS